jgi:hypothetical protein
LRRAADRPNPHDTGREGQVFAGPFQRSIATASPHEVSGRAD